MKDKWTRYRFRVERTRTKLAKRPLGGRPRLCVYRSLRYIYAQIIDDAAGHTLVSASSLDKEIKGAKSNKSVAAAAKLGEVLAKKAVGKGIKKVVFDRGGYQYHGRVKALAEAVRAGGLEF